jgi:hypothetical protein
MSTPAALPGLTGQDAADLLIGDVARLAVIDWKIAAYQAGEDGAEPPPPPRLAASAGAPARAGHFDRRTIT